MTTSITETIEAYGHPNIQATHPSTLMFTREKRLTKTGDCIIAVAATKSVFNLSQKFKEKLKSPTSKLIIVIAANGLMQEIHASGSTKLTLIHPADTVIRKSDYISDRTLAVHADKASSDLPRTFVEKLKNSSQKITIKLTLRD